VEGIDVCPPANKSVLVPSISKGKNSKFGYHGGIYGSKMVLHTSIFPFEMALTLSDEDFRGSKILNDWRFELAGIVISVLFVSRCACFFASLL
jgi:hypothetical protein